MDLGALIDRVDILLWSGVESRVFVIPAMDWVCVLLMSSRVVAFCKREAHVTHFAEYVVKSRGKKTNVEVLKWTEIGIMF